MEDKILLHLDLGKVENVPGEGEGVGKGDELGEEESEKKVQGDQHVVGNLDTSFFY